MSVSVEEKRIKWAAWYRAYEMTGGRYCTLAKADVGHDLRSEWFGVAFPTDVGEFQVKFDSERGEETVQGGLWDVGRVLRQNGYQTVPLVKH